jgi:hypothetical protein
MPRIVSGEIQSLRVETVNASGDDVRFRSGFIEIGEIPARSSTRPNVADSVNLVRFAVAIFAPAVCDFVNLNDCMTFFDR